MTDTPPHETSEHRPAPTRTPLDGRVIRLNVGGRHFDTYASTLRACPDGLLARMIDGDFAQTETCDGRLFVDRDGRHFAHILAYLRSMVGGGGGNGSFVMPADAGTVEAIAIEADYFGLAHLGDQVRAHLAAEKATLAPEAPPPARATMRILISRDGQKATLSVHGANPWGDRADWLHEACDVVFRQTDGRCRHEVYVHGGAFWSRNGTRDDAYYWACHDDGTAKLVLCDCSAVDVAALVDFVVGAMEAAAYMLSSVDPFPAPGVGAAQQSLLINLAFVAVQKTQK